MTDDNLPEDLDSTEDTHEQAFDNAGDEDSSDVAQISDPIPPTRAPRGNREDEPEEEENGLHDRVRGKFTSLPVLAFSTAAIVIVSLLVGWYNTNKPADVDGDWSKLVNAVGKIRTAVNQNAFNADLSANDVSELTNEDARAWFRLEIASALIAVATKPDNTNPLPPQMRQQQPAPRVLAGDQNAIDNRKANLMEAYNYLEQALERFSEKEAQEHALGKLGYYRAEYSAAYVAEILLLLDGYEDFDQQRQKVIDHLSAAQMALPQTPTSITNSTQRDIKALRDQIADRQKQFEKMTETQISDISEITGEVDEAAIYSWIGQYITAKNAPLPEPEVPDNTQDERSSGVESPAINTGDGGDFPIQDDATDDADEISVEDSTEGEADADE